MIWIWIILWLFESLTQTNLVILCVVHWKCKKHLKHISSISSHNYHKMHYPPKRKTINKWAYYLYVINCIVAINFRTNLDSTEFMSSTRHFCFQLLSTPWCMLPAFSCLHFALLLVYVAAAYQQINNQFMKFCVVEKWFVGIVSVVRLTSGVKQNSNH